MSEEAMNEVDLGTGLRQRKAQDVPAASPKRSTFTDTIKKLDVYAKTEDDFVERTNSGALVSLLALVCMGLLLVSEVRYYRNGETTDRLSVDLTTDDKLRINLDITFHSLMCADVNIDVMDVMGDPMLRVQTHLVKTELLNGVLVGAETENVTEVDRERLLRRKAAEGPCGDCHVPPSDGDEMAANGGQRCCNTCQDVIEAFQAKGWDTALAQDTEQCRLGKELFNRMVNAQKRSCRLKGYLEVNKIAGNFHFAPGQTLVTQHGQHIHAFKPEQASRFNVSHEIHTLSFGQGVPGMKSVLDGTVRISTQGPGLYQYFLKLVPTTFESENDKFVNSYQYAVTEHVKVGNKDKFVMPGIFFVYDLSPIRVTVTQDKQSLADFLTRLCAIIGGLFTLSGLVDAVVYRVVSGKAVKRSVSGGLDLS
eukprot:c39713_g1_i1.p1 GENE.c39713_g1_i1~~c39713_g1_i1.p1  ORF type:complete len:422 (-),score=100.76 c39713_g1_i1:137-1402(-)